MEDRVLSRADRDFLAKQVCASYPFCTFYALLALPLVLLRTSLVSHRRISTHQADPCAGQLEFDAFDESARVCARQPCTTKAAHDQPEYFQRYA
jgi:hypothetical protein